MNYDTESFIKKAKEIHGDRYNYSKSIYINSNTKVTIGCIKHGDFHQRAHSHVKGHGCTKCGREVYKEKISLKLEEFLVRSIKLHNNKYDYSLVNFKDTSDLIKIICPLHGIFEQHIFNHLAGSGCRKCGRITTGEKKTLKIEKFIEKANKVHNFKYDYNKVIYKKAKTPVCIGCPIHGDFWQMPDKHINAKHGCPSCGILLRHETRKIPPQGNSLLDLYPIVCQEWSDKNDSKPEEFYPNSGLYAWWKCSVCNNEWKCIINSRTGRGGNCPECAQKQRVVTRRTPRPGNSFLEKFPDISIEWSDKNELGPENYNAKCNDRVWWKCSKCDKEWKTSLSHRANGRKCRYCHKSIGEDKINELLIESNVYYQFQYSDKRCKHKKVLLFDFSIFSNNTTLLGLVEYNGKQHYELGTGFYGDKEKFKIRQKCDKIKLKFCTKNKIPFLIIPYTEYNNIETILTSFLKEINASFQSS